MAERKFVQSFGGGGDQKPPSSSPIGFLLTFFVLIARHDDDVGSFGSSNIQQEDKNPSQSKSF
jgi:hypothetical protein